GYLVALAAVGLACAAGRPGQADGGQRDEVSGDGPASHVRPLPTGATAVAFYRGAAGWCKPAAGQVYPRAALLVDPKPAAGMVERARECRWSGQGQAWASTGRE